MREIDGLRIADAADLKPIVEAFAKLSWPAPPAAAGSFAALLGWEMIRDNAAQTTLPVTRQDAGFLIMRDQLITITLNISDTLPRESDPALLATAYAAIKSELRQLLGAPTGSVGGLYTSVWWDLTSGGRIHAARNRMSVSLKLSSQEDADLERDEARHGISPEREV